MSPRIDQQRGQNTDWRRYTLTYTPSLDRILPSPNHLHVKIKNTSAIPLRAAYLHGPYTLYTACYPSTFDPNHKDDSSWKGGHPDFEPNLKAGGSWLSRLSVPEKIRENAGKANVKRTTEGGIPSCTWIIEVSSQVVFSTSATVHYELLIGRDEKSVDLGFSGLTGQNIATPGQLQDHQQGKQSKHGHRAAQSKGIFSKAVKLDVDDTESLWNKPPFPQWDDGGKDHGRNSEPYSAKDRGSPAVSLEPDSHAQNGDTPDEHHRRKQKRVHLVVLTHGLHSNLGSDLLYLKESIDAAAKQARADAKKRKSKLKSGGSKPLPKNHCEEGLASGSPSIDSGKPATEPPPGSQDKLDSGAESDSEHEEVIVRGFSGNAVRTERGIQYLGKRLAKHVLEMTYPDQPFLPVKKSVQKKLSRAFTGQQPSDPHVGLPAHLHSSIHHDSKQTSRRAYKITSISFIAHSLGGLTQTYAIAYIRKHSPQFFKGIKPINFVTMASPFLGLSNENPVYVKFALDFGLVGRTGQDLGLAWRAPAMVRSGWGAMIGGIGSEGQRALRQPDPSSKPLLRILPTGPAHEVLKLFRNRTVYSNVVNDGIVPLRTSCLLFLDWSGLGRVEKARRENGIVGTMAGWGWAELTGANSSSHRQLRDSHDDEEEQSQASRSSVEGANSSNKKAERRVVPQPADNAVQDETGAAENEVPEVHQFLEGHHPEELQDENRDTAKTKDSSNAQQTHPLGGLLSFLRPTKPKSRHPSPKHAKIYKRSQTLNPDAGDGASVSSSSTSGLDNSLPNSRPGPVRGDSIIDDPENVFTPPKTSIFESAGDILNPPLPSKEFIMNPASRPRTIFHDRVYHPEDIPPPQARKRRVLSRTFSSESKQAFSRSNTDYTDNKDTTSTSNMKVEEKIARAYHHEISWRKVLVRLEPDAHNNICVRRMFSNAYGWPVVKHLVDTHFSDSFTATTADEKEPNQERAKPMGEAVGEHGEEVETAAPQIDIKRTDSELREAKDDVTDLSSLQESSMSSATRRPRVTREDSAQWDDALFDITDDDSEIGETGHQVTESSDEDDNDGAPVNRTMDAEIADFLTSSPSADRGALGAGKSPVNSMDHVHGEIDASGALLGDSTSGKEAPPHNGEQSPFVIRGGTTSVGLGKSVQEQLARIGGVGKNSRKDARVEGDKGEAEDEGGSEDGNGERGSSAGVSELAHLP